MKLDTVIVSSDLNPKYLDFFPIVHKAWKDIVGLNCILILISPDGSIPSHLHYLKDNIIVYQHPSTSISPIFQSQCIRLLIPGLIKESKGILISDIDMIPMSRDYFYGCEKTDRFSIYRNVLTAGAASTSTDGCPMMLSKEFPMCYNAATPDLWRKIFKCEKLADVHNKMTEWYNEVIDNKATDSKYIGQPGSKEWNFDQRKLFTILNENPDLCHILYDSENDSKVFKRLDRLDLENGVSDEIKENIKNKKYVDFHMLRDEKYTDKKIGYIKLDNYKSINSQIFELLFNKYPSITNRTLKDPEYGTHIVPLMTAVMNTTGSILEFGIGEYSTPLLHGISAITKRYLISADILQI